MSSNSSTPQGSTISGGTASSAGGSKKQQVKDAMDKMPSDEKINLLKKAVVSVTKQKNELEVKLGGVTEDLDSLQNRYNALQKNYDATVKELEEVKTNSTNSNNRGAASSGTVASTVGALKMGVSSLIGGKKDTTTTGDEGSGGGAAGLSKEDAIAVMEENEKIHIQMFELKSTMEAKNGRLQQEVDSLKAALAQVSESNESQSVQNTEMEALVAKLRQESASLRKRVQTSGEAVRFFSTKLSAFNSQYLAELEYLNDHTSRSDDAAGDQLKKDAFKLELPQLKELLGSALRPNFEAFCFAFIALVPACSEAISTLFRGNRESAEKARQLNAFLVELKEHNTAVLEGIEGITSWREGGGRRAAEEDGKLEEQTNSNAGGLNGRVEYLLQAVQHWCSFFSQQSSLILRAIFLSAAIPVDDAKRDAEEMAPSVHAALLKVAVGCRSAEVALHHHHRKSDNENNNNKFQGAKISLDVLDNVQEGLGNLAEVLLELGQGAPNDKVRLALQHMKVKILQVADVLRNLVKKYQQQQSEQNGGNQRDGMDNGYISIDLSAAATTVAAKSVAVPSSLVADAHTKSYAARQAMMNSTMPNIFTSAASGGSGSSSGTTTRILQSTSSLGYGHHDDAYHDSSNSAEQVLLLRKQLIHLQDTVENLKLMLHSSDQRASSLQKQYFCAIVELEEKSSSVEKLSVQVKDLGEKNAGFEGERVAIVSAFESQIQVLSDQLTANTHANNRSMTSAGSSPSFASQQ